MNKSESFKFYLSPESFKFYLAVDTCAYAHFDQLSHILDLSEITEGGAILCGAGIKNWSELNGYPKVYMYLYSESIEGKNNENFSMGEAEEKALIAILPITRRSFTGIHCHIPTGKCFANLVVIEPFTPVQSYFELELTFHLPMEKMG